MSKHSVKLSYDQLDAKLKLCVLYCSLFHKGYKYDVDALICLWIALGYVVRAHRHQSFEEAGEERLISLINCGFFYVYFPNDLLHLSRCVVMHDVMHYLVTSLAGLRYKMADSNTTEFEKEVRHVSVMDKLVQGSSVWEVPSLLYKIKHLESFMTMASHSRSRVKVSKWSNCDKFISRSECLKVLVLTRLPIKELPGSIGELISLRHLDLSNSDIVKLPNSVTRLVNLLSLLLSDCCNLRELPKDMSKLVKLRHLKLEYLIQLSHMPTCLEKLTDLRTLDLFIVSGQSSPSESKANAVGRLADLNRLNHIKGELRIILRKESKDIGVDAREANLKMKEKLTHLTINFQRSTKEDKMVLEGLQPHPNLKDLNIMGYGEEVLPKWI